MQPRGKKPPPTDKTSLSAANRRAGSVYDLRVSVVTLQVGEDVVGVPAAEVAEAGLDPQHLPAEGGAVGAAELHLHRLGLVGDAAALVCAHAAVLGPVGPGAGAARDGEVGGVLLSVDVQAFFPWLEVWRQDRCKEN